MEVFRKHFRSVADSFVLIGGIACDEWFTAQGLQFRATKDVDIVLLLEAKDEGFAPLFWEFIKAGEYENRQKSTDRRVYYRFYGPKQVPGNGRVAFEVQQDLASFLESHPASDAPTWQGITSAVKTLIPVAAVRKPADLLELLTGHFELGEL